MKATFTNLPTEKQERILDAFLREFVRNDFEAASLTQVVAELGIAKGSVYQYFGSKQELYDDLQRISQGVKMRYIQGIDRAQFPDFWEWYRELFAAGIRFDLEQPLHSQFLYRAAQDRSNPELQRMQNEIFQRSLAFFKTMVAEEQEQGLITTQFTADFIAMTVIGQALTLRTYLENILEIDLNRHISDSNTVFAYEREHIFTFVDQCIQLYRQAFSPQVQ